MKTGTKALVAIMAVLLALPAASCVHRGITAPPGGDPTPSPSPTPDPSPTPTEKPEPNYADLGVNELGQIMILMYHRIGDTEDEWVRTPDNFRKDLRALYDAGYRLVSMNDVLDGNIAIPAGTSPVVLTFDDGTEGQFRYIEQGGRLVIDPDCAVGILEEFYREHPDFGLAATFYIFYVATPFGQAEYLQQKLEHLAERGFTIGNHTYSHPNLRRLAPDAARKELALMVMHTRKYLPGYQVRTLALPFGAHPDDKSYIISGSYNGVDYHHEGILLVGANPAPSPFSKSFNPAALPRVRASEMKTDGVGMYEWMGRLQANPQNRFVSDGNPNTVVIPASLRGQVNESRLGGRTLITYDR